MRDPVVPNPNIEIVSREPIVHSKATEAYLAVKFRYGTEVWEGYVPITYRRTGTEIDPADEEALYEHLNRVYEQTDPARLEDWRREQKDFWKTKPHAGITKAFFDKLAEGGWKCGVCDMPNNPNPQRRIQDLKEFGYTIATNGSLFVVQDSRLRRFSPLEAERLMGLPDRYTDLPGCKKTKRYQAVGNSWAVPVVRWIGERLLEHGRKDGSGRYDLFRINQTEEFPDRSRLCVLKDFSGLKPGEFLNCGAMPENARPGDMRDILCADAPEDIYLSPVGCHGILRRKSERGLSINPRLEEVLQRISSEMPKEEIEARSKIQRRGKFSK